MQILFNAKIYPPDSNHPLTAMAIDHGRILAVGSDADILAEYGFRAERRNLEGKIVWPGLVDAHLHLQHYALGLTRVDCETTTLAECLQRVRERARQVPPGEWILGHGWNQNQWEEGFGTAALLDGVAPQNPVYLTSKSIHSAWVNSMALQLAGITASSPDPEGGSILRDEHGQPNGILFESAMQLADRAIPIPTVAQVADSIRQAQSGLWKMGLTGVHDYDQATCFSALEELHQQSQLGLRVVKGIPLDNLPDAIRLGLRSGFGDDWLRIGSIKLFADGALGPQTAAMLQPYEGQPGNTGFLLLDAEQIYEHGQKAVQNGFSLAIHAIGDRANHEVLNALQQLRQFEHDQHLPAFRHRIEHVQLLHPADKNRLAELGVIASMQPIHAPSDMLMADRHWGGRSQLAYAWQAILGSRAVLAFGSDAPVESPNPFWGLHAAVTRCRQDGTPSAAGWYPEQRLTLKDALDGFTTGAAFAAGMENRLGKLAPGFYADLIVLDENPFECPPEMLFSLHPSATMVNGTWMWEDHSR